METYYVPLESQAGDLLGDSVAWYSIASEKSSDPTTRRTTIQSVLSALSTLRHLPVERNTFQVIFPERNTLKLWT